MRSNPLHHYRREQDRTADLLQLEGRSSDDAPTILGNDWRRYLLALQGASR